MTEKDIDQLIAELAKAALRGQKSFEPLLHREGRDLSLLDPLHLKSKLHNPPPVPPDIDEKELRLGTWMAVCQFAVFELIAQLDIAALDLLKSIAFGEYDWTQANALVALCRLYLDGKIPEDILIEIDLELVRMRNETQLYFAQDVLKKCETDSRFNEVLRKIKNLDFRLALAELGYKEPFTRDDLIGLGRRIVESDGDEEEIEKLMELFDSNVPHPSGSNLFYYPENYNSRTHDISQYDPTVEEVVDKCLSYKPIIL